MTGSNEGLIALLKSSAVFEHVALPDFDVLAHTITRRELADGEVLFAAGEDGAAMFVVAEGSLAIQVPRPDGETSTITHIHDGDVVGEMTCVDPAPRSATVRAAVDSVVYELSGAMLNLFRNEVTQLFRAILEGVTHRVTDRMRHTNKRIEVLLALGAPKTEPVERTTWDGTNRTGSTKSVDVAALRKLGPFTDPELHTLVNIAPATSCPAGTYLCVEGEPGDSCFALAGGDVEILRTVNGRERVLATLGSGTLVGQMALVDRGPRSASVRARREVTFLELTREAYETLLQSDSPLGRRVQEQLAKNAIRQLRGASVKLASVLSAAEHVDPTDADVAQTQRWEDAAHDLGRARGRRTDTDQKITQDIDWEEARRLRKQRRTDDWQKLQVSVAYVGAALDEWDLALFDGAPAAAAE